MPLLRNRHHHEPYKRQFDLSNVTWAGPPPGQDGPPKGTTDINTTTTDNSTNYEYNPNATAAFTQQTLLIPDAGAVGGGSSKVGLIVGAAVGGLVGLIFIATMAIMLYCSRREKKMRQSATNLFARQRYLELEAQGLVGNDDTDSPIGPPGPNDFYRPPGVVVDKSTGRVLIPESQLHSPLIPGIDGDSLLSPRSPILGRNGLPVSLESRSNLSMAGLVPASTLSTSLSLRPTQVRNEAIVAAMHMAGVPDFETYEDEGMAIYKRLTEPQRSPSEHSAGSFDDYYETQEEQYIGSFHPVRFQGPNGIEMRQIGNGWSGYDEHDMEGDYDDEPGGDGGFPEQENEKDWAARQLQYQQLDPHSATKRVPSFYESQVPWQNPFTEDDEVSSSSQNKWNTSRGNAGEAQHPIQPDQLTTSPKPVSVGPPKPLVILAPRVPIAQPPTIAPPMPRVVGNAQQPVDGDLSAAAEPAVELPVSLPAERVIPKPKPRSKPKALPNPAAVPNHLVLNVGGGLGFGMDDILSAASAAEAMVNDSDVGLENVEDEKPDREQSNNGKIVADTLSAENAGQAQTDGDAGGYGKGSPPLSEGDANPTSSFTPISPISRVSSTGDSTVICSSAGPSTPPPPPIPLTFLPPFVSDSGSEHTVGGSSPEPWTKTPGYRIADEPVQSPTSSSPLSPSESTASKDTLTQPAPDPPKGVLRQWNDPPPRKKSVTFSGVDSFFHSPPHDSDE
ncbi:hypothetical protein HDU93_008491 [Gonapodya sp. JEL0774]|nr:hypothetical protein HDU93_008491 [Gonapodya sp. JEL0774]